MEKTSHNIVMLGGGGHAKVLICMLAHSHYNLVGILDFQDGMVSGIPVLGTDALLPDLSSDGVRYACVGVGCIRDTSKRKMLYEKLRDAHFSVPPITHKSALVSKKCEPLSDGVQVMWPPGRLLWEYQQDEYFYYCRSRC